MSLPAELPTVRLIPLTTQLAALRYPGTVLVETDSRNRLSKAPVALVFQLAAIDRRCVLPPTGVLEQSVMDSIGLALDSITGRKRS